MATEVVYYQDPPKNALRFIEWLNEKLLLVPESARSAATMEIDIQSGYEVCFWSRIKITYQVLETA